MSRTNQLPTFQGVEYVAQVDQDFFILFHVSAL